MRKVRVHLHDVTAESFPEISSEDLAAMIDDLQRSIRLEFYPAVSRPFHPIQREKDITHADIAIFFLPEHESSTLKETYYQAFVRGIPIFVVARSGQAGDEDFRKEVFERHPHIIADGKATFIATLRDYLLDFFHRELRKIFIPRYSQVEADSLLEGYRRDWSVFLPPSDFERARQILSKHHMLILHGPPHQGKSCLARNIMKEYREDGFRINEVLSPIFTPQLFLTIAKTTNRVITICDSDAYTHEWTWQITAAVMRMVFASIEKWVDESHPFIFVVSSRKIAAMIQSFQQEGWQFMSETSLEVTTPVLNPEQMRAVLDLHFEYYRIPPNAHESIFHHLQRLHHANISPSIIFSLLRFFVLPQGQAAFRELETLDEHLLTSKRLFQRYLQGATEKESLLLFLVMASEMELATSELESLIRTLYQYLLFMEGKIVDLAPQKQQWIGSLLTELGGAVIRFYDYDREERFVFTHGTIRTTINRIIKQGLRSTSHRILIEAIVESLLFQETPSGKYFSIRFLFDHYRAFSPEFRKKMLYYLVLENDPEIRSYLAKQLFRYYYLVGQEGFGILSSLFQDRDRAVRSECGRYTGLLYSTLTRHRDRFVTQIMRDRDLATLHSFAEGLALCCPSLDDAGKRQLSVLADHDRDEIRGAILFGLIINFSSLDQHLLSLIPPLLERAGERSQLSIARALAYLPLHILTTHFTDELSDLMKSGNPAVRSLAVQAVGAHLKVLPEKIFNEMIDLTGDSSPTVRRDIAVTLIKNYRDFGEQIFPTLLELVQEPRPYLRAAISSVVIEYFSIFSPSQQADFLQQFLQAESIEGVRKSLSILINSNFHLLKPDTEELYFAISPKSSPEFKANLAEQILAYFPQLHARTKGLINELAEDPSDLVRMRIASVLHQQCSTLPVKLVQSLFQQLNSDRSDYVRAIMAQNISHIAPCLSPNQLRTALSKMLADVELVRSNLGKSLISQFSGFGEHHLAVIEQLLKDPSIQTRETLLDSVREHFSELPENQAIELISALAHDNEMKVRFEAFKTIIELSPRFSERARVILLPLLTRPELTDTPLTRELENAAEIQRNLLPKKLPRLEGYGFSYMFSPARIIGGDFLGFFPLDGYHLGIALADISGKGIPAALLMANLQAWLSAQINLDPDPVGVANRLNTVFFESTQASRFVSLVYGILERESGSFTYVNAGHNYPLLFRKEGSVHTLTVGGTIMGVFPEEHYHKESISLEPGDWLIFYTDGVTESRNENGEEFGEERLIRVIKENISLPPKRLISEIERNLHLFSNLLVPHDDISIVAIQRFEL